VCRRASSLRAASPHAHESAHAELLRRGRIFPERSYLVSALTRLSEPPKMATPLASWPELNAPFVLDVAQNPVDLRVAGAPRWVGARVFEAILVIAPYQANPPAGQARTRFAPTSTPSSLAHIGARAIPSRQSNSPTVESRILAARNCSVTRRLLRPGESLVASLGSASVDVLSPTHRAPPDGKERELPVAVPHPGKPGLHGSPATGRIRRLGPPSRGKGLEIRFTLNPHRRLSGLSPHIHPHSASWTRDSG